eukprot:5492660-Prymnesium_polylepis.1
MAGAGSVGCLTEFTIEARDQFGNARGEGGDMFSVVIIGPGAKTRAHYAEVSNSCPHMAHTWPNMAPVQPSHGAHVP